jgi:glycine oxidase
MVRDAIVVGAGIIGGSIAWRLAQRGLRVTLLDAGRMGGEASWAGAEMLAPGGEVERRSAWSDLALESLRLYPSFVRELVHETGLAIDSRQSGAVEVAMTPEEARELDRRAVLQQAIGVPSHAIDPAGVEGLTRDAVAARFFPADALVDPRDVMRALGAACLARGVEIREGVRAGRIEAGRDAAHVETTSGVFAAARAVLAAGAWSSDVEVRAGRGAVDLPGAFPVRGHLLGYRLPAGSLPPIVRHGHTYLLQRAGGFTVAGTTSERVAFDRTPDPEAVAGIRARAARLLPRLADLAPCEAWLGFRPGIEGGEPAIRRVEDSALWLAYGHYRNGILLAPATAERVSAGMTTSGTE